jgi:hypothetical protein
MPAGKIAKLSGMHPGQVRSLIDHHPAGECAGMTEREMRQFLKEEQKEGPHVHPSLHGKRF